MYLITADGKKTKQWNKQINKQTNKQKQCSTSSSTGLWKEYTLWSNGRYSMDLRMIQNCSVNKHNA